MAPGTAGALLATVIWYLVSLVCPESLWVITAVLIVIFTILGVWSSNVVIQVWGKDPSRVVVDEMVGVWIPLLIVIDGNIYFGLLAFGLFRFFDIVKPLGIRKMESFKDGWGIMLDDILAGVSSLLVLLVVKCIIG